MAYSRRENREERESLLHLQDSIRICIQSVVLSEFFCVSSNELKEEELVSRCCRRCNVCLMCFRLLVFLFDTCMFKNRFLVCFGLVDFVSDRCIWKKSFIGVFRLLVLYLIRVCGNIISWCVLGWWFPSVPHVCMLMSFSLQKKSF